MRKEFSPRVVIREFRYFYIVFAVLFFIILRIPSLIEPSWYGDEGIYQVVGLALSEGRALYAEIWDNKPPLLYVIYAIFGGNLFPVKLMSLIIGALSVVSFFLLARVLFKKTLSRIAATTLFAFFFGSPILEGNIANAENFMLLPVITAFLTGFLWVEKKRAYLLILSGLLFSVAFLLKTVAIFEFMALLFILILVVFQKIPLLKDVYRHRKETKHIVYFLTSFFLPLCIVGLYFLLRGTFDDFVGAVFLQNVGYVNVENQENFPINFVFVKLLLLFLSVTGVYVFRRRFEKRELFLGVWLIFAVFSAFFSQRPYTHYVLLVLPALCLLIGMIIEERRRAVLRTSILIGLIALLYFQFPYYKKWISYYQNFGDFVFFEKSISSYRAFFDTNTPRDYEIAHLLRSLGVKEPVFVWSDSAQIYSLLNTLPSGRYIVAYHVMFYPNALNETRNVLVENNPKYVVQTLDFPQELDLGPSYAVRYQINNAFIYEKQD